jgi:HK97 gp10 family phage protein
MADQGIKINVEVQGLQALEEALKRVRDEFGDKAKTGGVVIRGLKAGAKLIATEAKARAPQHDPSGLTRELEARIRAQKAAKKLGKLSWRALIKYDKQVAKQLARAQRVAKKNLALIRKNIVSYPVKADQPTVVIRVSNKGYRRSQSLFDAAKGNRGTIRFRYPGTSPGYWWWVEFGTSRMKARPFMRPAFDAKATESIEAFKRAVKQELLTKYPGLFKTGIAA